MQLLASIHPGLNDQLKQMTPVQRADLARRLILAQVDGFLGLPGVMAYRDRLVARQSLTCDAAESFRRLNEEFQRREGEMQDEGATESQVDLVFRAGCFAAALWSAAASQPDMTARDIAEVLYDLGYAQADPDAYWEAAFAESKRIPAT